MNRIPSKKRSQKRILIAILLCSFCIAGQLLTPQLASALGQQYFDDYPAGECDVTDCNSTEIGLVTGDTTYVQKTGTNLMAYFTKNSGQITIDGANFCPTGSSNKDYIQTGDYYDSHTLAAGTNITQYHAFTDHLYEQYGKKYTAGDTRCDQDIVFDLTNIPADPDHAGLFVAPISINPVNLPGGGFSGVQNYYAFRQSGTSNYYITQRGGNTGFEVTAQEAAGPNNTDYIVRFGSNCSVGPAGQDQTLTYYDIDNDGGSGAQLNGKISMELIDADTNTRVAPIGGTNPWTPPTNSNKTDGMKFHFKQYGRYIWKIKNVYKNNTIQFSTPYDGIFFEKTCADTTVPTPPPPPPPPPIQPYFKATGGDIVSGASMSTPTEPCATAPHITTAGISSWNNNGKPDRSGAGVQYGAFAYNLIQGFVSGQYPGVSAAGTETNKLTFSNTDSSVNLANGLYGGKFNAGPCTDYWAKKPADSALSAVSGALVNPATMNGNYIRNGDLTINGGQIPDGKQVTIYVKGNVSISGNVTYANTTWSNRQAISSFKIIANGVIYVSKDATQLDGVYVAVPSSPYNNSVKRKFAAPQAGIITTCSDGFTSYDPATYATNKIQTYCAKQLTVNGSFAAHQVWLLRAYGSLATKQPAETFNLTPDIWWVTGQNTGSSTATDYQSVIGLPPVL